MKTNKSTPSKVVRGMNILIESYPKLFATKEPLPLAIGVKNQILAEQAESKSAIRRAIHYYCNSLKYLHSFKTNTHRYDLKGNPVIELSQADKEYAAQQCREIKSSFNSKKKEDKTLSSK